MSEMAMKRSSFSFGFKHFFKFVCVLLYGRIGCGERRKVKEGWLIKVDSLPVKVDFSEHGQMQNFFLFFRNKRGRNETRQRDAHPFGPGEVGVVDLLLPVLPPLVAVVVRREGVHLPHALLLPAKISIFSPPQQKETQIRRRPLLIEPRQQQRSSRENGSPCGSYLELICD